MDMDSSSPESVSWSCGACAFFGVSGGTCACEWWPLKELDKREDFSGEEEEEEEEEEDKL